MSNKAIATKLKQKTFKNRASAHRSLCLPTYLFLLMYLKLRFRPNVQNIIRAIKHVVYGTKCHFLYETDDKESFESTLENIVGVTKLKDCELGALEGCKSVAFSVYHDYGIDEAYTAASKAIELNEDNAVWHFILAKTLRRKRRMIIHTSTPSDIEMKHFEKAFLLSNDLMFGVYYAQMKRECLYDRNFTSSQMVAEIEEDIVKIYMMILTSNTNHYQILLKAALGFLRIRSSNQLIYAEKCLDIVEKLRPKSSAYLHYRGLVYERRRESKEALQYFKQAAETCNFAAEMSYLKYGWKVREVDPVSHLLGILNKYNKVTVERQQKLLLHLATSYYVLRNDVINAATYYLKAVNLAPGSIILQNMYTFLNFRAQDGIYRFLHNSFLPSIKTDLYADKETTGNENTSFSEIYKQLKSHCDNYLTKEKENITEQLKKITT